MTKSSGQRPTNSRVQKIMDYKLINSIVQIDKRLPILGALKLQSQTGTPKTTKERDKRGTREGERERREHFALNVVFRSKSAVNLYLHIELDISELLPTNFSISFVVECINHLIERYFNWNSLPLWLGLYASQKIQRPNIINWLYCQTDRANILRFHHPFLHI